MHRDGWWKALVALGVVLLGCALFMAASRVRSSAHAGDASDAVLQELAARTPDVSEGDSAGNPTLAFDEPSPEMPTQEVDGNAYVGSLHIPTLGIELPVAAECTDDLLRLSPCCYAGSYKTDDLIVCGEGYGSQFGSLSSAGIKDEVLLATVGGPAIRYMVSNVENEPLEDIDKILDDWDLTLFTFNADGTCCVVRCVRV